MKPYNKRPYSELLVKCVSNDSNTEDSRIWITTHKMTDAVWLYSANVRVGKLEDMRNVTFCAEGALKKANARNVAHVVNTGLNGPGIESWWWRDFPCLSRPALGPTQPPVQWVMGLSWG
jgi:hypothetical protein